MHLVMLSVEISIQYRVTALRSNKIEDHVGLQLHSAVNTAVNVAVSPQEQHSGTTGTDAQLTVGMHDCHSLSACTTVLRSQPSIRSVINTRAHVAAHIGKLSRHAQQHRQPLILHGKRLVVLTDQRPPINAGR